MSTIDYRDEQPADPTWPAEPWPLRRAPERLRPCFLYVGAWLGGFCYAVIVFSSLTGLTILPLVLAAFKPDARFARIVLWFHGLTGPDWFLPAYMVVTLPLFLVALYGMRLAIFIRIRYGKKYFDLPRTHRGRLTSAQHRSRPSKVASPPPGDRPYPSPGSASGR